MINNCRYFSIAVFAFLTFPRLSQGQATFQFSIQTWETYTTYDHPEKVVPTKFALNTTTGQIDSIAGYTESTYQSTQFGAGIRRARLRGKMTKGRASGFVQYDAATSHMTDAQIDYSISDQLMLRMGRFIGAGSQAAGLTSHTVIDFAERSIVGRLWASAVGRSDYRTFGLAVIGKQGVIDYQILANNGDGSLNLKPYGTKSSNSKIDTGILPQLDFMASTKLSNGLNLGLHYGLPNEDRTNISSATGFVYWKQGDYSPGKLKGKFDFARVVNHDTKDAVSLGWRVNGFYKLNENTEIGAGYETWDPNTDEDNDAFGNILIGINYSPLAEHWKDTLFKLVFTFKNSGIKDEPADPLIIYLVWQVFMH